MRIETAGVHLVWNISGTWVGSRELDYAAGVLGEVFMDILMHFFHLENQTSVLCGKEETKKNIFQDYTGRVVEIACSNAVRLMRLKLVNIFYQALASAV